jgi:peptidyl-prolyl cis-trans isomerase D
MLQSLRENSRNAIIYVLFGIIIAAFILSFGPGSYKGCGGTGTSYAAKVGGQTIGESEFRAAFIDFGGPQAGRERGVKEFVLERLIERELLAQEAERLGFDVSAKEAEDAIARGRLVLLGRDSPTASYFLKDGKFDYQKFKDVVEKQFGMSIPRFLEIERRELLADKMRELLRVSAKVSVDEVKAEFENRGRQVNLEYVKFSPRKYEDEVDVTPADVDAYVKAHADELKKKYEERSFLYKKLDKEAKLRQVFIDAKTPDAEKRANEAMAKLKAGTPFAEVVKAYSDEKARRRGGLMGWRKKGFSGLGPLEEKVFAAQTKKGDLIGPEKTERGFQIVLVEDFREGDVPVEAAQREIAEELVRTEKAKERARADAQALLAKVKAGEKLEALVGKDAASDSDEAAGADRDKPRLKETGLFSRRGEMVQDLGVSKELAKAAFELPVGQVAGPFDVGGAIALVRVKEKKEPDMADFDKRKAELVKQAEKMKAYEVMAGWTKQRCSEVKAEGRIRASDDLLSVDGKPTKYEPCQGMKLF